MPLPSVLGGPLPGPGGAPGPPAGRSTPFFLRHAAYLANAALFGPLVPAPAEPVLAAVVLVLVSELDAAPLPPPHAARLLAPSTSTAA